MAAVLMGSFGAAAIDVRIEESKRATAVRASFTAAAPCPAAWSALTDYEGLPRFVSSMKESRAERRDDGFILLTQRARAGFVLAGKDVRVMLRVQEFSDRRIEFVDLSDRDFDWYAGSWELEPAQPGCLVRYELQADRRFSAPKWLSRAAASRNVRELLEDVKAEIERR